MPADAIVDAAIASAPESTPALARDLRALVATLVAASPAAAIVLGGSVASARYGPGGRHTGQDIDLFLIEPTRCAAWRTLRSRPLRDRLEALPLGAAADVVVLWDALVRSGRTSVYGRVLVGDCALTAAIAESPAPPQSNLLRTAYLYLIESVLDAGGAERLVAKALLTAFRAWLRPRKPATLPMRELFALDATAQALAAARDVLGADTAAAVADALAWQRGIRHEWDVRRARGAAHRFLMTVGVGLRTRPVRLLVRHAGARLHLGASPFRLLDADRAFLAAARALMTAFLEADGNDGDRGTQGEAEALTEAERLVQRLTGLRLPPATARVPFTPADRLHGAARALDAYGRYYPHKILLPAPPRVPPPADASAPAALVSIVVPCRNGAATLPALLASIEQQEVPPGYTLETIVADNASCDRSVEIAAHAGATVVREPRHGASAARNAGARRARGATLVFLDADTRILGRDFLHHLLRALGERGDVGVVGAAIECDEPATAWGRADHMASFFNWQATQLAGKRHFHPSAAFAVRRSVWDATGGFDVELLGFHDFDFCRRVRALGASVYFEPAARVAHRPRATMRAVLAHAARWGWNVRRVYAPYDPRRWWFQDRPLLFATNVPVEVMNRIWVVTKRWIWRRPVDTLTLWPLLCLSLSAWGAGVAAGGYGWIVAARRHGRTARGSAMAAMPPGAAGNRDLDRSTRRATAGRRRG